MFDPENQAILRALAGPQVVQPQSTLPQPMQIAAVDWNKKIQNASDDEALKRIIRQMQNQGISPPVNIMPQGYIPRRPSS